MNSSWGGIYTVRSGAIAKATESGKLFILDYAFINGSLPSEEEAIATAKNHVNEFWWILIYSNVARKLKRWTAMIRDGYIGYMTEDKVFKRFRKPLRWWDAIEEISRMEKSNEEEETRKP